MKKADREVALWQANHTVRSALKEVVKGTHVLGVTVLVERGNTHTTKQAKVATVTNRTDIGKNYITTTGEWLYTNPMFDRLTDLWLRTATDLVHEVCPDISKRHCRILLLTGLVEYEFTGHAVTVVVDEASA
ncbi:hypothetical protein ACK16A_11040 [Klebsiella michiganensis]|uniref:hypothetical protein n=1 Tax=Klebsiella michiganensis TaxID=1134687 RepID=UPI003970FBB9